MFVPKKNSQPEDSSKMLCVHWEHFEAKNLSKTRCVNCTLAIKCNLFQEKATVAGWLSISSTLWFVLIIFCFEGTKYCTLRQKTYTFSRGHYLPGVLELRSYKGRVHVPSLFYITVSGLKCEVVEENHQEREKNLYCKEMQVEH